METTNPYEHLYWQELDENINNEIMDEIHALPNILQVARIVE